MNLWEMISGFGFWQWIGFLILFGMVSSAIVTMYTKTVLYICKACKRGRWDR
jgi:hypothetical protein